jgi:hypothetical protein
VGLGSAKTLKRDLGVFLKEEGKLDTARIHGKIMVSSSVEVESMKLL